MVFCAAWVWGPLNPIPQVLPRQSWLVSLHAKWSHPHFACKHCRLRQVLHLLPACTKQLCVALTHSFAEPTQGTAPTPTHSLRAGKLCSGPRSPLAHSRLSYAWLQDTQAPGNTVSYSAGAVHSGRQLLASCGAAAGAGLARKAGAGDPAGCQRPPCPITANLEWQLRPPGLPGGPAALLGL